MENTERVKSQHPENAYEGTVKWRPVKSIWFLSNLFVTIFIAPFLVSYSSFLVFIILACNHIMLWTFTWHA